MVNKNSEYSQNHRMAQVGRDLKGHEAPTPMPQAGPPTSTPNTRTRLPRAPSNRALNTYRDGAATTSLGSLFQHLTILIVKNFPLTSNLNLPSFNLKPFPLVLLPCYLPLWRVVVCLLKVKYKVQNRLHEKGFSLDKTAFLQECKYMGKRF